MPWYLQYVRCGAYSTQNIQTPLTARKKPQAIAQAKREWAEAKERESSVLLENPEVVFSIKLKRD